MRVEIRIAGLGGQGVVLAGQILGKAAVFEGFNAVQTQSYGAEARGSAAKSEVIISNKHVWYPYVRKCDILIVLSQEALDKYIKDLKENGTLIIDSTHIKESPSKIGAKVYSFPFSKIAKEKFGAEIYANMVVLGFLAKITKLVKKEVLKKAVVESVPAKFRELDLKALEIGFNL
ncbi:2-oxoacid:ferredoxin oxidoreductase subunit gamma [Candidatus Bathyarchaeota archaeon]|nr:MAG: 2-oxoacid:ferredoxin oxidoreductase subunit gamma [Candidatus Bathyarchaeota archaeon]